MGWRIRYVISLHLYIHLLIRFSKILAFNGDNATSNDKQTDYLHSMLNSFDQVNHVRCFNHTMQLSVKRLLKPFASSPVPDNTEEGGDVSQAPGDADVALASGDTVNFDALNEDTNDDLVDDPGDPGDDKDDSEGSEGDEDDELLESTAAVRVALEKVCLCLHYFL
jgi:hypothetical protein